MTPIPGSMPMHKLRPQRAQVAKDGYEALMEGKDMVVYRSGLGKLTHIICAFGHRRDERLYSRRSLAHIHSTLAVLKVHISLYVAFTCMGM
jgi:hypothetical protein